MDELLGERIRTLRNVRGLTQEEAAARIGVSRQRYARIEDGTSLVSLAVMAKIAAAFGVPVSAITSVLDEAPSAARLEDETEGRSRNAVFDMLDLFYANKHLASKIRTAEKA